MAKALEGQAAVVEPDLSVSACRDPDDNYLLALCEAGAADFLVTRDEDLLVIGRWKDTEIVAPRAFLARLESAPE
jgi:predicted nucleic acid-binding protein